MKKTQNYEYKIGYRALKRLCKRRLLLKLFSFMVKMLLGGEITSFVLQIRKLRLRSKATLPESHSLVQAMQGETGHTAAPAGPSQTPSSPRKAEGDTVPLLRATITLMPVSTKGTEKSTISDRSSLMVREPMAMSARW